jgi:acyl dehydratase
MVADTQRPLVFEDIQVGDELPPIERPPLTITQLVLYCGAVGVFDPIHFDQPAAVASGFPDIIANGSLRVAFLSQILTSWALPAGWVERLQVRHQGMLLRGDPVTTRGRVTRTWAEGDVGKVECEVWSETPRAGRTDVGTAVVRVPLRGETA